MVAVENGEMAEGSKSGRMSFRLIRKKKEQVRSLFHLECFLHVMMEIDWDDSHPNSCIICHNPPGRWAFRLKVGYIDSDSHGFIYRQHENNEALLCNDCTMAIFDGGHDGHKARIDLRRAG
jgi:hypothetical protein